MMRARAALGLLAMAGTAACAAAEGPAAERPEIVVSADLQVSELRPGVWMHTSWQKLDDGKRFPSNGLVVREGDHLVLVDTAWGEPPTEDLLRWIDRTLKLPVKAAVVTHFHGDRLGGAAALQRRRIAFHGHPLTAELAATLKLPPPKTLGGLTKAGSVDHVESAEVFYPGPAHTRDNVVVWLPRSRVLAGGCAVRASGTTALGNVADAYVKEWAASIGRVLERYGEAEVVIPGHGEPGGRELLEHTIELAKAGK
jgi:metallo-beta-lactamase class B VIM